MAQEGQEIEFAQQGQNNVGPSINSDIPEYQEPIEEVISERLDEDGKVIKDNYEYKKTTDPNTGQVFYETRKKGSKNWTNAGEEGSTKYRAITDVFGDDETGYKDSPERANWKNFLQDERQKNITSDQLAKAKDQGIDFSKYGVKVINYPYEYDDPVYDYKDMPPGHIEAVFYDKETGEPVNEIGGIPTRINRWGASAKGRTGDEGFTQRDVDFEALDRPGVRSADLDLSPQQMLQFIGEASKFKGTSYKNLNDTQRNFLEMINPNIKSTHTALGSGSDYNYDFLTSNCAGGVCRGLGLNRDDFTSAGITNPEEVMDYILQGNNVISQRGQKGPSKEEFLGNIIDKSGFNKYTFDGLSDKNINYLTNFVDNISREDAQKLAKNAPIAVEYANRTGKVLDRGIDLDQSFGDMITNTGNYWRDLALNSAITAGAGYDAIPEGTIPTAINAAAREYITEPVSDMVDNTVNYFKREGIGGLWPFEHGGQPGKYSNIINNNKMKYSNLFKNGGGYDNPGFKSLPQYVTTIDANPQSIANLTMRHGGEGNLKKAQFSTETAKIQQGPQGTPSPEELMAIIQKQQMQMQQMQMKMQQMIQAQQGEEEVGEAETQMQNTYRKKSEQDAFYIKQRGGEESPFWPRDKIAAIFSEMVGQGWTPDEAQKNLYNAGVISEQDYEFVQQVKVNHPGIGYLSRDEITNAYNSMVNQGATREDIQKTLYGGNRVSEKDYEFVQGLGSKKRKLKMGGENAPLELTTKQIAQIMAAGGSVKYL